MSNFTVLTSASCLLESINSTEFIKADKLRVVMGSLDRTVNNEATYVSNVISIRIHARFNHRTYANNLALLNVI